MLLAMQLWMRLSLGLFIVPQLPSNFQRSPPLSCLKASSSPLTTSTGKVANVAEWIQWTSDSLKLAHGISLFEVMNAEDWREIDEHERFAVLSHGVQDDPIFCYSNVATRETFGYSEDEFYSLASRYSAPPSERPRRQTVMDKKDDDIFWVIEKGIRQRKDQSLFEFQNVWLWNVYNPQGERVGQSSVFDRRQIQNCESGG